MTTYTIHFSIQIIFVQKIIANLIIIKLYYEHTQRNTQFLEYIYILTVLYLSRNAQEFRYINTFILCKLESINILLLVWDLP